MDGLNQYELIPYDKRLEFPKDRLRLGQELGSGTFGRVVKAEAIGLKSATKKKKKSEEKDDVIKTVAVKMVRSQLLIQNQVAALEALVSELKVMIYLGPHLNVVNLLGACTKRASKGKIYTGSKTYYKSNLLY
jgi:serine/threonine protein kinase